MPDKVDEWGHLNILPPIKVIGFETCRESELLTMIQQGMLDSSSIIKHMVLLVMCIPEESHSCWHYSLMHCIVDPSQCKLLFRVLAE